LIQRERREAFQQETAAKLAPLQQRKRKAEDAIVAAFATCERACQRERDLLRQLEDLAANERAMFELHHAKDQTMTALKLALANLVMWTRDRYFPATYARATWHRLSPFFRLPGRVVWGTDQVTVELRPESVGASRAIWRSCVNEWKPPGLGCPMGGRWCCASRETVAWLSLHIRSRRPESLSWVPYPRSTRDLHQRLICSGGEEGKEKQQGTPFCLTSPPKHVRLLAPGKQS
jgi:hypothetical protein